MFEVTMMVLITGYLLTVLKYHLAVKSLKSKEPLNHRFFISKIAHMDGMITKKTEA